MGTIKGYEILDSNNVKDWNGNLINEGLNNIEGKLFFQLQSQNLNCAVGEDLMEQYQKDVEKELTNALITVCNKFKFKYYGQIGKVGRVTA